MSGKIREKIKRYWVFDVALLIVALDQFAKWWVLQHLEAGEGFAILGEVVYLTLVFNTGAAFGLFRDRPQLLALITVLACLMIVVVLLQRRYKLVLLERLSLSFILGGALGNLIDRFRIGAVIDFIDLRIWPVFNIADSAITVGGILLILYFLRNFHDKSCEGS